MDMQLVYIIQMKNLWLKSLLRIELSKNYSQLVKKDKHFHLWQTPGYRIMT